MWSNSSVAFGRAVSRERCVFISCGRPQRGRGCGSCGQGGGGQKPDFFVDVINRWPYGFEPRMSVPLKRCYISFSGTVGTVLYFFAQVLQLVLGHNMMVLIT